jgi:Peptidase A4 family
VVGPRPRTLPDESAQVTEIGCAATVVSERGAEHRTYGLYVDYKLAGRRFVRGGGFSPDEVLVFRDTLVRDCGSDPERLRSLVAQTLRQDLAQTPRRARRDGVWLARGGALIIAAVLIVLIAALRSGSSTASPFAGYMWSGSVQSVAGTWTVPTILPRSRRGVAATWIGAQGPGNNGPFIQIGTTEQLGFSGAAHQQLQGSSDAYFAFWSDVVHHYHGVLLFPVSPGDKLSATMKLADGKWALAITDQTTGAQASLTTRQETDGAFGEAEWTQEDVTSQKTEKPLPYPTLSNVSFDHLIVDGRPPTVAGLTSQLLSEHGITVTPVLAGNDAFTMVQH